MKAQMSARGIIIAAAHSGAGKTTVTLAMLAALRRRGLAVRAAKAGPDYIDPAFHAAAIGAPSVNLDSWAMPPALLDALAAQATERADILVVEGVMGLFDGAAGTIGRRGATAELAAHFGLPVVLVLDVSRQAQSAAALVRGFATHDANVQIAGVILNRVASERHRVLVADAIEAIGIPVLGSVPREAELALPERHLGLVQAGEHADLGKLINRLVAVAQSHIDLNAIMVAAAMLAIDPRASNKSPALPPPGQRVALASDQAFSFVYPHLMSAWRSAGAEIIAFSPLADESPPEHADSCWLPGGYPELHAGQARRSRSLHRRATRLRADAPGAWRMRRLHGAGRKSRRCRRQNACDGWAARACNELCQAQIASRLSFGTTSCKRCARRQEHDRARP